MLGSKVVKEMERVELYFYISRSSARKIVSNKSNKNHTQWLNQGSLKNKAKISPNFAAIYP